LAREEARTLGMPELPIVVVPHPLGGEPLEKIQARGDAAVDAVVAALTRAGA
jgi:hypothetical protein